MLLRPPSSPLSLRSLQAVAGKAAGLAFPYLALPRLRRRAVDYFVFRNISLPFDFEAAIDIRFHHSSAIDPISFYSFEIGRRTLSTSRCRPFQ
jgi:hypothetical protein